MDGFAEFKADVLAETLRSQVSLFLRAKSLFAGFNSLIRGRKFPVILSRELRCK